MSRHIIIGDVHGCITELLKLLEKVQPTDDDTIVFIGDLIHKGPQSKAVVEHIHLLSLMHNNVVVVQGNHEEKHLRWLQAEEIREKTGRPNNMQHVGEYAGIALEDEQVEFLRNTHIAYSFKSGDRLFTCVHAGIPLHLESIPSAEEYNAMPRNHRKYYDQVMRCRYETPEGKMVSLGDEAPTDKFWADRYDGSFGHVFFGHQPFFTETPAQWDFATGIDLGAVYGYYLCAAIVENGDVSFVTVASEQKYTEPLHLSKREPIQ